MNLDEEIKNASEKLSVISNNYENANKISDSWNTLRSEFKKIAKEFHFEFSKIKQLQEDYLNSLEEVSQSLKWNENKKSEVYLNEKELSDLITKENLLFNNVNLFISRVDNVLQITSYFDMIFKSMSGGFVLHEIPSTTDLLQWKNNLEKLLQYKTNSPNVIKWIYEESELKDSYIEKLEEYKAELGKIDFSQQGFLENENIVQKDKTT